MGIGIEVATDQTGKLERDWIRSLGRRETAQFVEKVFRYRLLILPAVLLILTAFAIWDPVPWKLAWIAGLVVALSAVSAFELWRVRRRQATLVTLQVNLAVMILLQTGVIYITGGIESPMLPIYIPMCLAAGLIAPDRKRALAVAILPIVLVALFAGGCLYELIPRAAPAFFELGSGWGGMPVYVWSTAGVMMLMGTVTFLVSNAIRKLIGARVVQALEARQAVIGSLANRNRELLGVSRTIAHELKNPLASIQGLAQLVARGLEPGSKQAERLEVMLREIVRMTEVLDGFRNFTRPLTSLQLERVDLSGLVTEVVALHEGLASQLGVVLDVMRTGVEVRCDPHKVKQALINLLQNALEASPRPGRVTVRLGPWGRMGGRVEVQDSGPGISEQVRAHLFEPGFTTRNGGSGIGLVVARSIASQHGGSLTLETALSGGGLASLCLPADPPPDVLPDREVA